jgi:multiple sugar transport system permease protein
MWYEQATSSANFKNNVQKWGGVVKNFIMNIGIAIILTGVSFIILSPVFGIISHTIMDVQDLQNPLIYLIPENLTLFNLSMAWQYLNYVETLLLTLGFSLGMGAIHVVITSMVGYGFARFKFPGSGALFALVIVTIVLPVQTYMVPMYMQFRYFNFMGVEINLIGSYWSLGLLTLTGVGLRSGLYIYIFRQFFRGLPKEIEEAALIDGAGVFRTFTQVMLPNSTSAILTVLLFAFVWHYNDTFYTSLLITGNRLMGVMLNALGNNFSLNEHVRDNGLIQLVIYAGVFLTIAPVLTVYLVLQRHFIEGIERSGIVG